MPMNLVLEYLKFFLKSSNQHGVHSPFVYDFVTKCLYKKIPPNVWHSFLKIRRQLLNNKTTLKVTDFGAGSTIFKSDQRKVSKITTIAGIAIKKAKLVILLVNYFQPKNVLEIGTSLGLGTSAIKIGNKNSKTITLEGCPETSKIECNLFQKNNFKNIDLITGDFNETLPEITRKNKFDFIYFDGNHTKKATLAYFETCLPTTNNNSVWIFDDIYWSKEMKEAWSEIKNHPRVTVTVDIFYWGIVFFRKEQAKEHFKIRV